MSEVSSHLADAQTQADTRLVSHLNGLTYRLMNVYPQAEVESWTLQKQESDAFLGAGEAATVDLAPFISQVCFHHHGPSDGPSLLLQVRAKCEAVRANAIAWAAVAAFVNGVRARRQEEIYEQTTIEGVYDLERQWTEEVLAFRNAVGI